MRLTIGMAMVGACATLLLCAAGAGVARGFGFSTRSIKGTYASSFQGSVIQSGSLLPINGTAVLTADGKGNISGHESFVFNGTICTNATSTGTYKVNPDGSGTTSFVFTTAGSPDCSGTYTQGLAIADSGNIVVLNNINASNQISEIWRKQK